MAMSRYYVLGVYNTPWVLAGYATRRSAEAAIRWQNGAKGLWVIATRTGPDTFLANGRTITAQRGPYTVEAFEAFKAEWRD